MSLPRWQSWDQLYFKEYSEDIKQQNLTEDAKCLNFVMSDDSPFFTTTFSLFLIKNLADIKYTTQNNKSRLIINKIFLFGDIKKRTLPKIKLYLMSCFPILLLLFCSYSSIFCFIFPGKYCTKTADIDCRTNIDIFVNSLYSSKTLLTLKYDFSGFCPIDEKSGLSNNIGQSAIGDRFYLSSYNIKFGDDLTCSEACQIDFKKEQLEEVKHVIKNSYQHEWVVDNLPVLHCMYSEEEATTNCAIHFYFGCSNLEDAQFSKCTFTDKSSQNNYIYFNHLNFEITYLNPNPTQPAQIISITVSPESKIDCKTNNNNFLGFDENTESLHVRFTYSVKFIKNNSLSIQDRYNYIYTNNEYGQVRWMSISLSIIIVVILTSMCTYLLVRAVHSDISRYTELINTGFDTQDEYGWKLLKGDIFRAPKYRLLLSVSVGNGIQIVFMTLFTLLFTEIGFHMNQARGSFVTCLIALYIILGCLSGFVSARIYKFFDGEHWKLCVLMSALFHPGIIFSILLCINLIIKMFSSGYSISFIILFELFALWTFVSIPLTFAGAIYGFKRRAIKSPVKRNLIPRTIPHQTFYTKPTFSILFGGFICFLCIYLQLYYIINSIWLRFSYLMFGLLFLVTLLFIAVCAQTAFVFCYFCLRAEDYRWQWRSFLTPCASALYSLIYLIFYINRPDKITSIGSFVFFGYSSIMLYMLILSTGSVGFLACFYLLLKIFSSIKIE